MISRSILFRARNVSNEVAETIKTRILFSITCLENRVVYEIMWRNNVQPDRLYIIFVILSVCFILFYFISSYSVVETSYNITFGIVGLLIISIFGSGSLMWLICPTPSVICLTYYLNFLTMFVVFTGG
jgi:hypothetical protein